MDIVTTESANERTPCPLWEVTTSEVSDLPTMPRTRHWESLFQQVNTEDYSDSAHMYLFLKQEKRKKRKNYLKSM